MTRSPESEKGAVWFKDGTGFKSEVPLHSHFQILFIKLHI